MAVYTSMEDVLMEIEKIVEERKASEDPKIVEDAQSIFEKIRDIYDRGEEYGSWNSALFSQLKPLHDLLVSDGWEAERRWIHNPDKARHFDGEMRMSSWPKSTYYIIMLSPCGYYEVRIQGSPGYMGGQLTVRLTENVK